MKAKEFDEIFDKSEEDIVDYLDLSNVRRPNLEPKRINIDFPAWMVKKLDEEAQHIGVSRQAIIKTWLAEKIMDLEYRKVSM
ncbi:type II toxin-antitoxin system BrnA family antitoxin [Hydrogenimonas thermophila]|uniref:CopG antitoxin of type II toxin-antitoxin system n=1 Tax=Hydrogenimonas thermophila TaxID=223786 RepID=A0A1I5V2H0_9BACT|nr:CopG family antitoxin [Hydrogenimonas thermophila]SFQ01688.1 CopG antitoxin of type II toxin-antitoxin system [Hydrogenimonas thermophila]